MKSSSNTAHVLMRVVPVSFYVVRRFFLDVIARLAFIDDTTEYAFHIINVPRIMTTAGLMTRIVSSNALTF